MQNLTHRTPYKTTNSIILSGTPTKLNFHSQIDVKYTDKIQMLQKKWSNLSKNLDQRKTHNKEFLTQKLLHIEQMMEEKAKKDSQDFQVIFFRS